AARYLVARNGWLCRTFVCSPNGTCPRCRAGASAPQRRPFVEERHDPRSRDVAGFQPVEPKARFGKQIVDLAVEVTPAREPQPEGTEPLLPAGDPRFRRAPMPHEQQPPADLEHATHVHEGSPDLGNAAAGPCHDDRVHAAVRQRDAFAEPSRRWKGISMCCVWRWARASKRGDGSSPKISRDCPL